MQLKKFRRDLNKETAGVWHDLGDGARVLVASMGHPRFRAAMDRAEVKRRAKRPANGIFPSEVQTEIVAEAMSFTVLLDWEGIEDDAGAELVYSREEAFRVLADPAMRDFSNRIAALADDAANFREEEVAEIVGNSSGGSTSS
jgi:hypothetical protein